MYRIGDFSRLSQVSVKTLHHYDEVGLLRPARVDRDTGYRFYAAEQVAQVRRIRTLKALGFSLEQIAGMLDGNASSDHLQAVLLAKREELQQLAHDTADRLTRLETWLKQITEEDTMPRLDVVVKKMEPQLVASMREQITDIERLAAMFAEIEAHITRHGGKVCGPGTIISHDSEFHERCADVETVYPIAAPVPETPDIRVYELPAVDAMACLIYQGAHNAASEEARQALATWIEEHGYRINGPDRVAFLYCDDPGEDEKTVVEFQFPVERIA